jgi:hypothetical protein
LVFEIRPYLPLIPQVVDHLLERVAISINEYFILQLLELVVSLKHFLEGRAFNLAKQLAATSE